MLQGGIIDRRVEQLKLYGRLRNWQICNPRESTDTLGSRKEVWLIRSEALEHVRKSTAIHCYSELIDRGRAYRRLHQKRHHQMLWNHETFAHSRLWGQPLPQLERSWLSGAEGLTHRAK